MFSRLIYSSVTIGILAGLILSIGQMIWVNPIIFAAESYEVENPAPVVADHTESDFGRTEHHGSGHQGNVHQDTGHHGAAHHSADDEEWSPEDGFERSGYTVAANISIGIGFAAVLLAIMSQIQLLRLTQITTRQGLLWGLAGFTSVFVAPGIGLPPEIPGIEAATVESRQGWWLLAAGSFGVAFLIISFGRRFYRLMGVPLFAVPYLVHIPHPPGPSFVHPDPEVVASLTQLHQSFIINSGVIACVFWIALGVGCAFLLNRWVYATGSENNPAL